MTSGERIQLTDALEILRNVDAKIDGIDNRLRLVELHIAGQVAVESAATKKKVDRRVVVGLVISACIGLGGLVVGLINALN